MNSQSLVGVPKSRKAAKPHPTRFISCTSCHQVAQVPAGPVTTFPHGADDPLVPRYWVCIDIGGRDFYLCLWCQAADHHERLRLAFQHQANHRRSRDAAESLAEIEAMITARQNHHEEGVQ